jgi:Flp pilus assembly protein TadG
MDREKARRSGQAVLEFALVLPIFLLLILAATDFGRAYLRLHLLTNAAREGARAASLPGSTDEKVRDTVDRFLKDAGLDPVSWPPSEIVVTDPSGNARTNLSEAQQGDRVRVTLEQNFQLIGTGFVPGDNGTIPLDASCTFRHE